MASPQDQDFKPPIPPHLQVERTTPLSLPPDYIPPFPVYSAKFAEEVAGLTMAIIGAQFAVRAADKEEAAVLTIKSLLTALCEDAEARPSFMEWASVTDRRGYYNITAVAYWKAHATFDTWRRQSGFQSWWDALETKPQGNGWFLEVFSPSVEQIEVVSSDNWVPEGAGCVRDSIVGPIREHAYWGSMRDRLPSAQTDRLDGEPFSVKSQDEAAATSVSRLPQRIRVPGRKNLAVIRSGQDWRDASPRERKMYLSEMHPVLQAGMDFLRDEGEGVGCYSCRLMDIITPETGRADQDKTFGLAFFNELASLESWSKHHPTHLAIFGGFLRYAKELGGEMLLRLGHEVSVLRPEQQLFEYIGCHRETGMLVAAA